jgi:hypothetical protein
MRPFDLIEPGRHMETVGQSLREVLGSVCELCQAPTREVAFPRKAGDVIVAAAPACALCAVHSPGLWRQREGDHMRFIRFRLRLLALATPLVLVVALSLGLDAQAGPTNVRVTVDSASRYVSADVLGGTGTYTDITLARCGVDRRMQNEPTIALDPRNPMVRTAGSNDYCAVPTNKDAWAGFYRSTDGGLHWTDSLLPGYPLDASPQGISSPVHQMALGGALAAGDPVQAWDTMGNLFYMGNNFNRGIADGGSFTTRDNTGDVWVATYAPANPKDPTTDGSRYVRTVILATNTFGQGSFNDKTGIGVDPLTANVYATWSDFHGVLGCNDILLSRSTDHGASFSQPLRLSSGLCSNQGPNVAFGPAGQVYVSWFASTGGTLGTGGNTVMGAAFTSSLDGGITFANARIAVPFTPFTSEAFSGNGARNCGDGPFSCPTGFTFPRFDLAMPTLTTNGPDVDMAFQVALASGQGQIQFTRSSNGGASWSTPTAIDVQPTGHQFFTWMSASAGRITAVYYDSRADPAFAPRRPPCNNAAGMTSNCLNVWSSTSTDGGQTWSHAVVTDTQTNPNLEQFGTRRVPFFGDYIMVSSVGSTVAAAWTDQRNAVVAPDSTADNDGADVAGDPETGGTCTSSFSACFDATGGLDQNIYTAQLST